MVFNATFNNISAISWRSVLMVEETGVLEENHRPDKVYHIMLYRGFYCHNCKLVLYTHYHYILSSNKGIFV